MIAEVIGNKEILYNEAVRKEVEKMVSKGGKYYDDIAFQDIIDALTEGKIRTRATHSTNYWRKSSTKKPAEIFAELSVGKAVGRDFYQEDILKRIVEPFEGMTR